MLKYRLLDLSMITLLTSVCCLDNTGLFSKGEARLCLAPVRGESHSRCMRHRQVAYRPKIRNHYHLA